MQIKENIVISNNICKLVDYLLNQQIPLAKCAFNRKCNINGNIKRCKVY